MCFDQWPGNVLAAIFFGLGFGVAFVYPLLWWTALPSLVLLLFFTQQIPSFRRALGLGWIIGTVHALLAMSWMWSVYPLEWVSSYSSTAQLAFIALSWVLVGCAQGFGGAVFIGGAWYLVRAPLPVQFMMFPLLLIGSELARSLAFFLVNYGSGSVWFTPFGFGYLGYTLASHPFLSDIAVLGGVSVLSGLVMLIAWVVWRILRLVGGWFRFVLAILLLGCFFGSAWVPSTPRAEDAVGIPVATVHTDTRSFDLLDESEQELVRVELVEAVRDALSRGAQYIVLPENANLEKLLGSESAVWELFTNGARQTVLIDSSTRDDQVAIARFYDTSTQKRYEIEKVYLVPQGEYMSHLARMMLSAGAGEERVNEVERRMRIVPGVNTQADLPAHLPGVLFCIDSAVPGSAAALTAERALPFIAHQVSHAWFHEPRILRYQLDQMLKVHAISGGVPILQATNRGLPLNYAADGSYLPTVPVYNGLLVHSYLVSL